MDFLVSLVILNFLSSCFLCVTIHAFDGQVDERLYDRHAPRLHRMQLAKINILVTRKQPGLPVSLTDRYYVHSTRTPSRLTMSSFIFAGKCAHLQYVTIYQSLLVGSAVVAY